MSKQHPQSSSHAGDPIDALVKDTLRAGVQSLEQMNGLLRNPDALAAVEQYENEHPFLGTPASSAELVHGGRQ